MTLGSRASCGIGLLALLILASGCATVVKGTDESVTVQTDPAGATCDLTRDGQTIGVINPSPGTVQVDRASGDIVVKCDLEGYETTEGRLVSEFTGATLGNLLLGGVFGLAVDAVSGANNEYPDSIFLIMSPNVFVSEQQRDAVYAKRKEQVENRTQELAEKRRKQCLKGAEASCERQIKEIEEAGNRELLALEAKRLQAPVKLPEAQAGVESGGLTSRAAAQAEEAYWRTIENSGKPEAYRAYLAAYPDGRFKDKAVQRLRGPTAGTMTPDTTGPMPKPELAEGDTWIGLKDGKDFQWKVVSIEGDTYTGQASDGCRWTAISWGFAPSYEFSNCKPYRDARHEFSSITGKLWPLQVGNKISYAFTGHRAFQNTWRGTRTCEVKSRETITTISGEHDTFKIVCNDAWTLITDYVSPRLEASVYLERRRKSQNQTIKYELIRLRRAGSSVPAEIAALPPPVKSSGQTEVAALAPIKSRQEVEAYLDSNSRSLHMKLEAYNEKHRLAVSDGRLRRVRIIYSIDIRQLHGDTVVLEIYFQGTGNPGMGFKTGPPYKFYFDLRWIDGELEFINHREV